MGSILSMFFGGSDTNETTDSGTKSTTDVTNDRSGTGPDKPVSDFTKSTTEKYYIDFFGKCDDTTNELQDTTIATLMRLFTFKNKERHVRLVVPILRGHFVIKKDKTTKLIRLCDIIYKKFPAFEDWEMYVTNIKNYNVRYLVSEIIKNITDYKEFLPCCL